MSSIWMRIAVFLWAIVFPAVFVALPLAEVMTGEGTLTAGPFWALGAWLLGPAAVAIGVKYFGGGNFISDNR
ncbi:MAG: hypothetical protein AAFO77_03210 [Pseudomonadota bacterium]